MKFLFFGDSFTAGTELLDYKYISEYPEPKSFDDIRSSDMIEWRDTHKPLHQIKAKQELDIILEQQKSKTYAYKLATSVGVASNNYAVPGSGLQKLRYTLVKQISKESESDLTVFIQPPTPERWMEYATDHWRDFAVTDILLGLEKDYFKYKISNNTDYSWYCHWILDLQAIYDFCSNHKNIKKFYFIDSGNFNYVASNKTKFQEFTDTYNSLISKIQNDIFTFPHLASPQDPNYLPWGHVKEEIHEKLAIEIQEKIC